MGPDEVPHGGADMATGTALERVHAYWDRSADRIREAAKWMATVIGSRAGHPDRDLALRRPVGQAPGRLVLGDRARRPDLPGAHPPAAHRHVLLPSITSYDAIQMSDPGSRTSKRTTRRRTTGHNNPLQTWKQQVESQQDLWLPSGVKCLVTLREAMIVDELTLTALSDAESKTTTIGPEDQRHLREAQQILVSRLRTWRAAASRIVLIGELYRVRNAPNGRSTWESRSGSWVRCRSWWHSLNSPPPPSDRSRCHPAGPIITGLHELIVLGANLPFPSTGDNPLYHQVDS